MSLFIGQNIITLKEVASTNNYALALCKEARPIEGTVVVAENQTNGRGQHSNTWESEPGKNITLSLILKPEHLKLQNVYVLNKMVALGVAEFINALLGNNVARIKWPNDILIDGQKISGILIENIIRGSQISYSVVGIGCNVNQSDFHSNLKATSLSKIKKEELDISKTTQVLFDTLEAKYLMLKNQHYSAIANAYNKLLYKRDNQVCYTFKNGKEVIGTLKDVDDQGNILIDNGTNLLKLDHHSGSLSLN